VSSITLTPDTIEVSFTRGEKIGGLVRDQSFLRSAVTTVSVVDDGLAAAKGLRAPGLALPGRRKVGTWRRSTGKELVAVRRGEPALRLTLAGQPYVAAVIGTPDAHALARELSAADQDRS